MQLWAIQSPGDTRWLSNTESLDSILKDLGPLMERLEQVGIREREADAASLFGELVEVETLLSMFMALPLLDRLGRLCKILQVRAKLLDKPTYLQSYNLGPIWVHLA